MRKWRRTKYSKTDRIASRGLAPSPLLFLWEGAGGGGHGFEGTSVTLTACQTHSLLPSGITPKERWAIAGVHRRQAVQGAERKWARQRPIRPSVPFGHKSETRGCPWAVHRANKGGSKAAERRNHRSATAPGSDC